MSNIPKPPERGDKTTEQYLKELERWAHRLYDTLRYLIETGGQSTNGDV